MTAYGRSWGWGSLWGTYLVHQGNWCYRCTGPYCTFKNIQKKFVKNLVYRHSINVCCRKNLNQNSKQCWRYKNDKFGLNVLMGQKWSSTCVMYYSVSNLLFLYLEQCFKCWVKFLWQRTLMSCQCSRFFSGFFRTFFYVQRATGAPVAQIAPVHQIHSLFTRAKLTSTGSIVLCHLPYFHSKTKSTLISLINEHIYLWWYDLLDC